MKMNIKKYAFVYFLIGLCLVGCKKDTSIDWGQLELEFSVNSGDSLHLEALEFLRYNMQGMKSEIVILRHPTNGQVLKLHELTGPSYSEETINALITDQGFRVETNEILDDQYYSTAFIKERIEEAIQIWKDASWHDDIPKEIFLEYLLPFKIEAEYPGDWRIKLNTELVAHRTEWQDSVELRYQGLEKAAYIDKFVNEVVVPRRKDWFNYNLNTIKLGNIPSFPEISIIGAGDCFDEAAIDVYLNRSIGIPSGYDIIPYWANVNGTHATAVYYNTGQKKMRKEIGFLYNPAKVFRRTFSRQNIWTEKIKPIIKGYRFAINFLKSDRIKDVTHEHVATADITLTLPIQTVAPVSYITVLSYGKWVPVFWGKVIDNKVTFENMGKDVIYRLAIPSEEGELAFGIPFLFTNDEVIQYPEVFEDDYLNFDVNAINSGKQAYVKQGKKYVLFYLNQRGEWVPINEEKCHTEGQLRFSNVQRAIFYKLVDKDEKRNLSRIFSYSEGKQIWH